MKTLRLWLIIVLAVLIPIRGAVAAGMLCAPMGTMGGPGATQMMMPAPSDHAEHAHHHEGGGHHGMTADEGTGSCNLCAAFCSATALLSAPVALPVPQGQPCAPPAAANASAAVFLSDGQDRPPRSA